MLLHREVRIPRRIHAWRSAARVLAEDLSHHGGAQVKLVARLRLDGFGGDSPRGSGGGGDLARADVRAGGAVGGTVGGTAFSSCPSASCWTARLLLASPFDAEDTFLEVETAAASSIDAGWKVAAATAAAWEIGRAHV